MTNEDFKNIVNNKLFVVGEYTTDNGPYGDDYFIVIVNNEGDVYEYPFDSSDAAELLKFVGIKNNENLELCNSVEMNSNVIYPESLVGEKLFSIEDKKQGIFSKILSFGSSQVEVSLSSAVRNYLF